MRVLVTGATGFVGRWLVRELAASGHDPVGTPSRSALDITDADSVDQLVGRTRPEAVVHLAGIAFGPDARRHPAEAVRVNVGGARNVLGAVARRSSGAPVVVVSSSEVYGRPDPGDLPLGESAALASDQPYGRSKIALEEAATEWAPCSGSAVVIVRPFNHTGPGQRLDFVVPALAARILAARDTGSGAIRVGNVDVRRDFSDVRDVVRAYRLLVEWAAIRGPSSDVPIFNVAAGRSTSIRSIVERLALEAGIAVQIETDPALVRSNDPADIRGDATALRRATGWRPAVPFEETLRDVLRDVRERRLARAPATS